MRKLFTFILCFLMAFSLWAESPETISYQAVVRNTSGRLLRETNVGVRISILQDSENGSPVYTETRVVKTNNNGLMTFAIGDENAQTSDNLSKIQWANSSYFLRCEIDLGGGENYTLSSTSPMNSVPYALYAKHIDPEALPSWAQGSEKPTYNYTEIEGAPTNLSELKNDLNFITKNDSFLLNKAEADSIFQPKGNYLTEHQSLAEYARKNELPKADSLLSKYEASVTYQLKGDYMPKNDSLLSKMEADTTYQKKGNYLTEHQSLAGYATKSELPKADSLLSKAEASTTYQPKGSYLTEHQSLAGYATKSELPKADSLLSKAEASTTYQPKGSYLTEHQSLAGYATKSELPKADSLLSKAEASTTYQPKGSYLTEHQSLAGYATKSELPKADSLLSKAEASTTYQPKGSYLTEHQSLAGYATKSELPKADSLLSKAEASTTYQPKGSYLTEHQSLADYAKKTDIPAVPTNVSSLTNDAGYITAADIPTAQVPSLIDYAKKSELPKADSLLSKAEASTTYQPKGNYLTTHQSLEGYATSAEVKASADSLLSKTEASTTYQPKGNYLTTHQSLEGYATSAEVKASADSLLSKTEASTTYQPKGNYLTTHQSLEGYATSAEVKASADSLLSKAEASTTYQPKGSYLTEHQSLADYAKKKEVPTKVSELTNDKGYITAADIPTVQVPSLTDYAKKSELPKADSLLSKAEASTTYQPKGNYLTTHQSLEGYATSAEVKASADSLLSKTEATTTYATKTSIPTKVSQLTNDKGYLTEHQSLAAYAKKTDVPTKVSQLTNDKGYLTEHQSLAAYATKSELPKADSLLSKAEASTTYATKASVPTKVSQLTNDKGYLTEHQSLTAYAKKTDVPTKVSQLTNDKGYLTEHQSLTGYAKKSDLPKADSLLSKAEASTTYLTEHQSLEEYAKKTDLPTVPTNVSELINDAKYITTSSIPTNVSAFENDAQYIKKAVFDSIVNDYNALLSKYQRELDSIKTATDDDKQELDSLKDVLNNVAATSGTRTVKITNGALPGTFSVSATKKVQFSMGNLQYQASTSSWKFASNQYDFVGVPNSKTSSSNAGWVDLFGWGTSGYDNSANDTYATNHFPYSTSTTSVNTTYNYYGYGPSTNQTDISLVGTSSNYDWGVYNTISNGGNEKVQWRVLTSAEWTYLYSGRPNAASLRTKATIEGVAGMIFFPDNWTQPDGISIAIDATSFAANNFSALRWNVLEANGAVFLPAAGNRSGTTMNNVGSYGYYWSSTYYSTSYAYDFYFYGSSTSITNSYRYYGHSVRLVKTQPYNINVTIEPAAGGIVDGVGSYEIGSKVKLTAKPADGYFFKKWSDGNTSITRDITSNTDVSLTAEFETRQAPISGGGFTKEFSVSADKKVTFSQGNLQYNASSKTWRFAEHQYDMIGANNSKVSATNSGWIDLFGWGTSGWSEGVKAYQPYATSTTSSDYYIGANSATNMVGNNAKADWGVNNGISNGGSTANQWRVLTSAEWTYLYSGRTNAAALRTRATVSGVPGYIFFPDGWTVPANISVTINATSFTTNVYEGAGPQWNSLEASGAVFLPAAGYRSGTSVSNVNSNGRYWLSTTSSTNAYYYTFTSSSASVTTGYRYYASSVRLVKTQPYNISVSIEPAAGGTVDGTGTYEKGSSVTLTAKPASGYFFKKWSDGSTTMTKVVTSKSDVSLTAVFETRQAPISGGGFTKEFSISADKKVTFSQGNLQYNASTKTWRFAENQYDMIGANNSKISATNSGWIDLFGWGTSGWSDGVYAYTPYSTSTTNADYNIGGVSTRNMVGNYAKADWGVNNPISNGGATANQWRTLSSAEWTYLYSGRPNATTLRTRATIAGVAGYLFFPDGWTAPTGVTVTINASSFTQNIYQGNDAQWNALELSGAVFLPAAGRRSGTSISSVGSYGYYWSNTTYSSSSSYEFYFSSSSGGVTYDSRYYGYNVRLVKIQPYTINVKVEPAAAGTIDGVGSYEKGSTVTLTARAKSGYFFKQWSDGVTSVTRQITSNTDVNLTAQFITKESATNDGGMIPAYFSVSSGKTVKFSRGNLQYNASTDTWRFADNQYDVIGTGNASVSATKEGWIDLFGWGTTGYDNTEKDIYARNFRPYSSSTSSVNTSYNSYGYGPSTNQTDKNLVGTSANYDWGVYNAISNGGNKKGQWRTLTNSEWSYLYSSRTNASNLRTRATVAGVAGYIFLPDNWVKPDGVTLTANASSYTSNNYTASDWEMLEENGAVFLPAAGNRSGTTMNNVGSYGYYWSSTYYSTSYAYHFYFYGSNYGMSNSSRYYGFSVRLVQE